VRPPRPESAPEPPVHRDNFNLLRLLFASAVLFSHCFELIDRARIHEPFDRLFHTFSAGDLAVDGFFLLSGYLILQSWCGDPNPARYLARRALRIYPAFIVATLLCGLALGPLFGGGPPRYFAQFHPLGFAIGTLLLREPVVPPVFIGNPYADVNGSMWTIQYEFMCYLIVIVAGLVARNRRGFWWTLWLAAMALNLFAEAAIESIRFPGSRLLLGDEPAAFVRFLGFFGTGALCFLYRERVRYRAGAAALCTAAVVLALFRFDAAKLLLPTAGAYLLFWFAFRPAANSPLQRFVRRNDLSYGVYLFAWPAQQILIRLLHVQSAWALLPLAAIATAGCGLLSWRWVEKPFLSLKPHRRAAPLNPGWHFVANDEARVVERKYGR
jgi:peptidoglycan/LPS O-acetylase OafA/YrhL